MSRTRRKWSKEAVIEEIRRRHSAGLSLGYNDTVADDEALTGAAKRWFGSWYEAVEAAGFDPEEYKNKREPKMRWDKPTVLAEIKRYSEQGGNLSAGSVRKHYSRLYSAATVHFGSWKNALKELGIDYDDVRLTQEWTPEKVLQTLQEANRQGADLSDRTVSALRPDLYGAAITHFGSWPEALRQAGIEPEKARRTETWSREKLIETARRAYECGITPAQLIEAGLIDTYTVYRHIEGGLGELSRIVQETGEHGEDEIIIENRLAEIMDEKEMSINRLAKRINRSRTHIRHIMNSTRTPKLADALLIARELGCHVENIWYIK